MNWLLTAVLCVILVELVIRLPFVAATAGIRRSGGRALHVVRAAGISDHWKEKAMAAYARATFLSSMKLAGLLIAVLAVAYLMVLAFEQGLPGFQDFILGWLGLVFSALFASAYAALRWRVLRGRV
ncbi:hypothetical protein [Oceanibacterium hippocampi]|uniref:Uncharacterized protein n=1 Tax=Oceanibacterium hippocampi TaxID=745714 RepID=A0A1Y5TRU6_9PROT|nr:hypothetical protein [Oceanibacterium hippocampi]SLN70780.1 hypothetical protein OCH7691_03319 [Oceanibacterium hippocampi]